MILISRDDVQNIAPTLLEGILKLLREYRAKSMSVETLILIAKVGTFLMKRWEVVHRQLLA